MYDKIFKELDWFTLKKQEESIAPAFLTESAKVPTLVLRGVGMVCSVRRGLHRSRDVKRS
jgi:hypothetical protein